ncbi:MAG: tetratricopeptide repeat protein, partial [Blastocatellia bacterium]
MPTVLLLCVTAFDSNPAASPKIAAGLQESKPTAKTKTKEAPKLKPGKPIERETAAGQTHEYRLKLGAGEFARVTVQQLGVDVSLKLTGSNGEQLAEVNNKKSRDESETLLFIAEAKGSYLLEVSAAKEAEESKEAAEAGAKRYRAEMTEPRAATEQDRNRVAAERKHSEADLLRADKKPESFKQATQKYQDALTLWRGAKDRQREADALGGLGATFSLLNEHQQARDQYNQALAIRRELGDRKGEASALGNLGFVHNSMRQYKEALGFYELEMEIRRETGDERRQANALTNIGQVHYLLRDFGKSVERLDQALPL